MKTFRKKLLRELTLMKPGKNFDANCAHFRELKTGKPDALISVNSRNSRHAFPRHAFTGREGIVTK
jgi:hypothetical protein